MSEKPHWDIGIWGTYAPPYGGIANHIIRLTKILDNLGIRARIFNRASKAEDPPQVVSILGRQCRWFLHYFFTADEKLLYVFSDRPLVLFLAYTLKLFRGKSYILRFGTERVLRTLTHSGPLGRWMARMAIRHADYIVAVSPHLLKEVSKIGIPAEKIHIIPGFIPPPDLSAEPPQAVLDFCRSHSPVLAANGQVRKFAGEDMYGMDLLIEVLKDLRKDYPRIGLALSLYGTEVTPGDYADFKRRLVEEDLVDRISIRTEPHEFWPVLKHADLFLRPTRTEGDSSSIREAIFLGVPVIASDTGMRPKDIVLFPSGSAADIIAKTRNVLADLPKYEQIVKNIQVKDNSGPIIELLKQCLDKESK
jgi:glycosyltransferase involved in cell wall biosynthesis